jgi:hypothetical protein
MHTPADSSARVELGRAAVAEHGEPRLTGHRADAAAAVIVPSDTDRAVGFNRPSAYRARCRFKRAAVVVLRGVLAARRAAVCVAAPTHHVYVHQPDNVTGRAPFPRLRRVVCGEVMR